jgi:hypothetical protein
MLTGERGEMGKGVSYGTPQANFQKMVLSNVVPLFDIFPKNSRTPWHFGKTLSYLPLDFPPCERASSSEHESTFVSDEKENLE